MCLSSLALSRLSDVFVAQLIQNCILRTRRRQQVFLVLLYCCLFVCCCCFFPKDFHPSLHSSSKASYIDALLGTPLNLFWFTQIREETHAERTQQPKTELLRNCIFSVCNHHLFWRIALNYVDSPYFCVKASFFTVSLFLPGIRWW